MALFDDRWRGETRRVVRIAGASSSLPEGGQYRDVWNKANPRRYQSVGDESTGFCNTHVDYLTQVNEIYRMLEGAALWGGEPTKTVLGYRTSFLAGEGIRVAADTTELRDWVESWLKWTGLDGRDLTMAVSDSEIVGHVLLTVDDNGMVECHPSFIGYEGYTPDFYLGSQTANFQWMQPAWWPTFRGMRLVGIQTRMGGDRGQLSGTSYVPWLEDPRDRFVYIRTGGHGNPARFPAPTSRLCLMIDSLKNYDRAVREARKLNDRSARQVTVISHADESDATDLETEREYYRDNPPRDGDMISTRGQASILSANPNAVETLSTETALVVKHLSGISAIPPHWLGYVDLMSNRATAESLFEAIAAGTHDERLAWERGMTRLIEMARMVLDGPAGEFTVSMPLLSYRQFAARNEALMQLVDRGIISDDNVRSQLPFDADEPEGEARRDMNGEEDEDEVGRRRRETA